MGIRFLQISDLHLTHYDPDTGEPSYAAAKPLWGIHSSGYWGHSYESQVALEDLYVQQKEIDPRLRLLVSGDMTSTGHIDEFAHAKAYIEDSVTFTDPAVSAVGLQAGQCDLQIPGNHDHWNGRCNPFGGPTAGLAAYFPHLPGIKTRVINAGAVSIRFIMINTDAEVAPKSWERFFAIGSFVKQLNTAVIPAIKPNEIRVLMLHHSYEHRSGWRMEIAPASKDALERFLVKHHIRVMMSGHTHAAKFTEHMIPCRPLPSTISVLETRCGTSTQDSDPDFGKRKLLGIPLRYTFAPNSAVLHTVTDTGGGTVNWLAENYVLKSDGDNQFKPDAKSVKSVDFPLGP